jgi:outer membrane autotransporter protein
MTIDVKKLLLAGTAVIAVGAFASTAPTPAYAADEFSIDADSNGTFDADELATSPFDWATNTNGTGAAGEATDAKKVQVNTTGTINGIQDTNKIGSGTGNAIVAGANAKTLTISDSVNDDAAETVTIDGDISKGAFAQLNLTIAGNTTDATADVLTLDINGDIDLGTGTLTVDTDTNAGNAVALKISGDVTAAAIVLKDDTAPITVTFDGTSAQTVTGTLDGETDADGTIVLANTSKSGITFASAIGATQGMNSITLTSAGEDVAATFKGNVKSTAIVLGDGAATDTNTMTFNSTGGDTTVTGTLNGTAGDTDIVNVNGGNKTTFVGVIGGVSSLQQLNIAASTTASVGANVSADTITLQGADAELNVTAAATITGDIKASTAGQGILNIDHNTTVAGSIGETKRLASIDIITGKVLTVSAAAADRTIAATSINLEGAASGLTLTPGANDIIVANDVTTSVDGAGVLIISDGAGTVTFNEDVGASTTFSLASLTLGGGTDQTLTTKGNVFVDAIALDDEDTWNILGSDVTISGTVAGVGAGDGNIIVGNGSTATEATFSSAIGGTTVDEFNISKLSTANISHNVATTASGAAVVGVDVNGRLNIDTSANTVAVSTATGDTDIDGTVAITGSTATADSATISGASDLFIDGDLSVEIVGAAAKTLTLAGTGGQILIGGTSDTTITAANKIITSATSAVNIGVGALAGDNRVITLAIGRTADFDPDATAVIDATTNTDPLNFDSDAVFKVTAAGLGANGVALADGSTITVIDGNAAVQLDTVATTYGALLTSGDIVLQDTGLIDFVDNASTAQDLLVTVNYNNPDDVLSNSSAVGAADSLMDFAAADDELQIARNNLLAAPTADAANEVAESLTPDSTDAATQGALNVSNHVMGITTTRLASLRTGTESSGIAAGNSMSGNRMWGQVFGTTADQGRRDGVDGYDADTVGMAVGVDGETVSGANIGVALSYGNTNVDSKDANDSETDVDSYQITVYGDMPLNDNMFLDGMVGYAFHNNDTTRHNVGGIAGLDANGDFDANQFMALARVGRDFAQGNGMTLTPSALAHWSYYDADNYTETGAGAANLSVDSDTMNVFELGVGVDASWDLQNNDGSKTVPTLSAGYRYNLGDESIDTTSSFQGGGAAFDTDGLDQSRHTLNLGAAVKYYSTENWELSAEYDFEYKADYDAHSGQIRAGYRF